VVLLDASLPNNQIVKYQWLRLNSRVTIEDSQSSSTSARLVTFDLVFGSYRSACHFVNPFFLFFSLNLSYSCGKKMRFAALIFKRCLSVPLPLSFSSSVAFQARRKDTVCLNSVKGCFELQWLFRLVPSSVQSGGGRTRTDDPRVANAMLSQLSYAPIITKDYNRKFSQVKRGCRFDFSLVYQSGRARTRIWDLYIISVAL
jgi:hypothetical protein